MNAVTAMILPFVRPSDDTSLFDEDVPSEDKQIAVLKEYFPRLVNDLAMLLQRPFQLHWDPTQPTASTDCKANVYLSPAPFLAGRPNVGFGSAYHEAGHILHSPYGMELLERAKKQGGDTLVHIVNLILDRKDDRLIANVAPGATDVLRRRLLHICTMVRRKECGYSEKVEDDEKVLGILRHLRPRNPYEDFFYACKWGKKSRTREARKAMHCLRKRRLDDPSVEKLLWLAECVREQLGEMPRQDSDGGLSRLMALALYVENGEGVIVTPAVLNALKKMMAGFVSAVRKSGVEQLLQYLQKLPMAHPGPLSVGLTGHVPIKEVKPDAKYATPYDALLKPVTDQVDRFTRALRKVDSPSEYVVRRQDEGELDLEEVARIACGLPGCYKETVIERDVDAEMILALDCSGSMKGEKLLKAKQIAALFTEGVLSSQATISGSVLAFSSNAVYDFGVCARNSGFVTATGEASNSDTHMLAYAGKKLARSRRKRRILLVLCDDGPDDMVKAGKMSREMLQRGVITIHLLVGVVSTPLIYPFELLYSSMEECLDEFGNLVVQIIKRLR